MLQDFYHWGTPLTTGALDRWEATDTRGVLSLSTAPGGGEEIISPGQIANGRGDDYILGLGESITASGQVVYIRLFPEMNGHWNPYCAFEASGEPKGPKHSTAAFRKAWARIATILHGGRRLAINRKLRRLGMPRVLRAESNSDPEYEQQGVPHVLPQPKVALMWVPQTVGSPYVAGNRPEDYWPGGRYVDWVGADIFSKFSSMLRYFSPFYRRWDNKPFVVGEYAPWDNDYSGWFTGTLFDWVEDHGRARMVIYYRSVVVESPFDINRYPGALTKLRHVLNRPRYDPYAPGTRD